MVPLNWRLAPVELVALGQDADPAMVIHDDAWAEAADRIVAACDLEPTLSWGSGQPGNDFDRGIEVATRMGASRDNVLDDPTHILYTSGTTGVPKGAFVTNKTLLWQGINCTLTSDLTGTGTKQLNPLPLFHAGGLTTLASGILMSGGCVAVVRRFDPELCLAWLADPDHGITHFNSPPVMWQGIADVGRLRHRRLLPHAPLPCRRLDHAARAVRVVAHPRCRDPAALWRHRDGSDGDGSARPGRISEGRLVRPPGDAHAGSNRRRRRP